MILPTLRVRVESGVAMGPGVVVIELSVSEVADAFVEGIWGKPQRGVGISRKCLDDLGDVALLEVGDRVVSRGVGLYASLTRTPFVFRPVR